MRFAPSKGITGHLQCSHKCVKTSFLYGIKEVKSGYIHKRLDFGCSSLGGFNCFNEKEACLRKVLIIFSLLLLTAGFICAQEFGAVRGKVTDNEGNALPGVSITLTGGKTAPRSLVSSAESHLAFLQLPGA